MWGIELTGAWAVVASLLLIPGVLAALIRDRLSALEVKSARQTFVAALVYDSVIYVALLALAPLGITAYPTEQPFNIMTVVAAFLLAVAVGTVAGICSSKGIWHKLFFWLGWTKKGPTNTWMDGFQVAMARGAWAYVHLKDGRRILGVPRYYSMDDTRPAVFLGPGLLDGEPVEVYESGAGNPTQVQGPGVLVTPNAEISLVCFLDGVPVQ